MLPAHFVKYCVLGLLLTALGAGLGHWYTMRWVVPGVLEVKVGTPEVPFLARLDTGAEVSSINATALEVVGGEGRPTRRDVGRRLRFTITNEAGVQARMEATIAGIHAIRTADCREYRYDVVLPVRHGDRRAQILMNLNDRARSAEKLLLGRNWLESGYLVDASRR